MKRSVSFGRSRGTRRRSKYGNVRTNGFASKREAAAFDSLMTLQRSAIISDLKCQVPYRLEVNGRLIAKYVADFVYVDRDGKTVVADSKGFRTRDYVLRKKLMKAIHGIDIQEL